MLLNTQPQICSCPVILIPVGGHSPLLIVQVILGSSLFLRSLVQSTHKFRQLYSHILSRTNHFSPPSPLPYCIPLPLWPPTQVVSPLPRSPSTLFSTLQSVRSILHLYYFLLSTTCVMKLYSFFTVHLKHHLFKTPQHNSIQLSEQIF